MFKNLRTSTKLLLLCGLFVGSIVLATYSLIREQQIAINFVRQELLGTQYLGKLRAVYAAILTDESSANAGRSLSADSALDSLAAAESQTAGSFDTAKLEQDVAAAVRKLSSEAPVGQKHALIVDALSKARDLAAQIGDDFKLALDPDLNSYYLQNLVVKRVPALLSEIAELQALMHGAVQRGSLSSEQLRSRHLMVSFELGAQEYALPLDRVREIIPLPDQVSEIPRSETAVLGVVTLRDRLLPLVSLRALLGLPSDPHREERGKVVVLSMGSGAVGMVADRTREIIRIAPGLIDPAPALLTRGAGDAEITSICRLDHGKRLVAVLSPDRLFRSDLVRRVLSEQGDGSGDLELPTDGSAMAEEQFVIFRLGDQEYGLPVAAVDEIARPPDHVSRLPRAPAFIDGVMNLRGSVVPIVDLRRRFEVAPKELGNARRILVLALGGGKTGFMVDGVSEVMRVPLDAIRPAPELSPEQMRLISRVANLDAEGRIILLVDPAQLLDQVEADVLAKFDRAGLDHASKAS